MAINQFEETVTTLNDARRLLPKSQDNKRVSLATLHRWIRKGIRGRDGNFVQLESMKVGRECLTRREALKRVSGQLSPATDNYGSTENSDTFRPISLND